MTQRRDYYCCILQNSDTQFLGAAEGLSIDHWRIEKPIGWSPCCSDKAIRYEMRPAIVYLLWRQELYRLADALLQRHIRPGHLPYTFRLAAAGWHPGRRRLLGIFIQKKVAILPD